MVSQILYGPRSRLLWGQFFRTTKSSLSYKGLFFHILAESCHAPRPPCRWANGGSSSQVQGAWATVPLFSVPTGTGALRHLICTWALWTSISQAIILSGLRWIRLLCIIHMKYSTLLEVTSLWCSWKVQLYFLTLYSPSALQPQMWTLRTLPAGLQDGDSSPKQVREQNAASIPFLELVEGWWLYDTKERKCCRYLRTTIPTYFFVSVEF